MPGMLKVYTIRDNLNKRIVDSMTEKTFVINYSEVAVKEILGELYDT